MILPIKRSLRPPRSSVSTSPSNETGIETGYQVPRHATSSQHLHCDRSSSSSPSPTPAKHQLTSRKHPVRSLTRLLESPQKGVRLRGSRGKAISKLQEAIPSESMPTGHSYPTQEATSSVSYTTPPINDAKLNPFDLASLSVSRTRYALASDLLSWLQHEAPVDILPRILSFAGSRQIAALSHVSTHWRTLCLSESVWQTACEDTGKYKRGVDPPLPSSMTWLRYYRSNPIVPIDYDTIQEAFRVNGNTVSVEDGSDVMEHRASLRVLLQPRIYVLRDALIVKALENAKVTIETIASHTQPPIVKDEAREGCDGGNGLKHRTSLDATITGPSNKRRLRHILSCRPRNVSQESDCRGVYSDVAANDWSVRTDCAKKRARLVLKTKKLNEPIIRVQEGKLVLKGVDLVHTSHGIDIWGGNAAVQVQPTLHDDPLQRSWPTRGATAVVDSCDISSASGRGVVAFDGGEAAVSNCHIHHCAATGIYIGGPGSTATIEHTDVVFNGDGNLQHRNGITRGHSGVYLEQGSATLRQCNISRNSLTGLSVVSADNASLDIQDSDLVANGTVQLEMPPRGSRSERKSISKNNRIEAVGISVSRSNLVHCARAEKAALPQSPLPDGNRPPRWTVRN